MNQTQMDVMSEALNNAIRLAEAQVSRYEKHVNTIAADLAVAVAKRDQAQAELDALSEDIDED